MRADRKPLRHTAFTLIEILVVVAIIGLLVAVLLPAFNVARTKARVAQAQAQFRALDTGIEMFRSETNLGSVYPPSASDNPEDRQMIANPKHRPPRVGNGGQQEVKIAGAHLLAQALIGADGLGTPGFRDLGRDGLWWNDTHDDEGGLYEIDPESGEVKRTRYGGAGYVDDQMKQKAKSLADLVDENRVAGTVPALVAQDELLFTDPWDTPILYYRASKASLHMVASADQSGIYRQEDNGVITGTDKGDYVTDGVDFGAGKLNARYHDIFVNLSPLAAEDPEKIQAEQAYDGSFARYILDPSVKARPTPVRPDSYLLVSPGPDARYGTEDDITNWQRVKD